MVNYATKADTFTKTEVNHKFTDIIAGAPNALNTLKELSDAFGTDHNFSATILNQLIANRTIALYHHLFSSNLPLLTHRRCK